MYIKLKTIPLIAMTIAFGFLSTTIWAQDETEYSTPFDSFFRATYSTYVFEPSQYSSYKGPDVSQSGRQRYGIYSLSKTQRVYVDELSGPISVYLQLIDVSTDEIIHEFTYPHQRDGALLFNGDGVVYQYEHPKGFCYGYQTKKYLLKANKLVEVQQPLAYFEKTETKLLRNVTLYFSASATSEKVASLLKGTPISVISAKEDNSWFLIKTPLGLTGWISERSPSEGYAISITACN